MTDSRASHTGHNLNIHTENYLKTIWNLSRLSADPKKLVQNSQIAQWLHIKRPTVSEMLYRLNEMGFVELVHRKGVLLSPKGEKLVLGILRRHRLIELFLQETLKLSSLQAHEEAEVLEHAVTPTLCAHIEKYLGNPEYDLDGMPIPKEVQKTSGNKVGINRNAQSQVLKASQLKSGLWANVSACPDYDKSAYKKILEKGIQVGLRLQRLDTKGAPYSFKSSKGKLYSLSHQEAELIQMKIDRSLKRG